MSLGLALVGCAYLTASAVRDPSCGTSAFDRAEWLRGDRTLRDGTTTRFRIAEKLISCRKLVGRDVKDVHYMLRLTDKPLRHRRDASYSLGTVRGIFTEEMFLNIAWRTNDVVNMAEIAGS